MIELEKRTAREKLLEWYLKLDPLKRKRVTLWGGCGLLFLFATLMITLTSDDNTAPIIQNKRKVEYTLFNGKRPRDLSIDGMAGKLNKLTEDFSEIRVTFQRQEQKIHEATQQMKIQQEDLNKRTEKLSAQTTELYQKLQEAQESLKAQVPLPEIPDQNIPGNRKKANPKQGDNQQSQLQQPALLGQQPGNTAPTLADGETAPVDAGPKIRIVTGSSDNNKGGGKSSDGTKKINNGKITEFVNIKKASTKNGVPDMFLPAGSILSGTLITGLDAPTSNQSRQDPFPALLRVKHEAILPNRYRMDIRECFLIASGYGDMSSERAYMRAERISCVKKDGAIIEVSMDAYSVGEDGKAGIRGRLVSKNGQIIANALMSGFISGITNAFAPQRVQALQTNVVPGQQQAYQYPSPEMIGGQALAGGVKGAATQIADYYIHMAKNIFPIIEIDAGRKVDFIMIRGMSLQPKSKQAQNGNGQSGSRNATAGNAQDALPNMIGFGSPASRGVSAGMNGIGGNSIGGMNSYGVMNNGMVNGQTSNNGFWPNQ